MYPTINKTSKDDYVIAEMISKKSYKKFTSTINYNYCYYYNLLFIIIMIMHEYHSGAPAFNRRINFIIVSFRNDVVVLKHPQFPEQLICKRITLVEGDKLPNNKIYNSHSSKVSQVPARPHS